MKIRRRAGYVNWQDTTVAAALHRMLSRAILPYNALSHPAIYSNIMCLFQVEVITDNKRLGECRKNL